MSVQIGNRVYTLRQLSSLTELIWKIAYDTSGYYSQEGQQDETWNEALELACALATCDDEDATRAVSVMRQTMKYWDELAVARQTSKYKRAEIDRQRKKIFATLSNRYGHLCAQCGSTFELQIDHIRPIARGGSNDLNNLQLLCRSCNSRKGAKYG